MPHDNPNDRGWRVGNVFIDLGRVVYAYRSDDGNNFDDGTLIRFEGVASEEHFDFDQEEHDKFLTALTFYRSSR